MSTEYRTVALELVLVEAFDLPRRPGLGGFGLTAGPGLLALDLRRRQDCLFLVTKSKDSKTPTAHALRLSASPKPVCERSCLEHRILIRNSCISMPCKHPKNACACHIHSGSQKTPGTLGMYAHDSLGMQHALNGLTGSVCTANAPTGRVLHFLQRACPSTRRSRRPPGACLRAHTHMSHARTAWFQLSCLCMLCQFHASWHALALSASFCENCRFRWFSEATYETASSRHDACAHHFSCHERCSCCMPAACHAVYARRAHVRPDPS